MRFILALILMASAWAQAGPRIQFSHTTESLRGVSAVSHQVAWASGTHGTYLRTTDGGATWTPAQVPDAATLDFRGVVAFSSNEAFLMSSGPGEQSRIYHTTDGGQHWNLQFTNSNPKGFFDSIVFWDPKHGVVLGDPIPDDSGKLKFEVLLTDDGETWHQVPPSQLPEAIQGEGAFAAGNSCIAILPGTAVGVQKEGSSAPAGSAPNIWFATGGKVARVFHSPDRGKTWEVFNTPILQGPDSAGIFSIAFRDPQHGVIAGGDYKHPRDDGPNLAFTSDGGKTWTLSDLKPQAYFSAIAYDQQVNAAALKGQAEEKSAEANGKKIRVKPKAPQRLFIIGEDFVFDFRPPSDPRRISGKKGQGYAFNAVSPYPEGGALIVGPKGTIASIP
ncbi:MAG TPA: YCF48-related protein [Candidatus Sulfotelmatobacter sp.]|nr:YCF48-related protein [Candidatus Sulfotelmatobacter sp.]